jgi:hypothetical protein
MVGSQSGSITPSEWPKICLPDVFAGLSAKEEHSGKTRACFTAFATIANENLATSHKISEPKTCAKNNSSVLQLSKVCSSGGKGSAIMKLAWLVACTGAQTLSQKFFWAHALLTMHC